MISDQSRVLLKRLVFSPEWRVVEQIVEIIRNEIKSQPIVSDTEWETLKNAIGAEKEERGIIRLMQRINDEASKAK